MSAALNCGDEICPPQGGGLNLRFGKSSTHAQTGAPVRRRSWATRGSDRATVLSCRARSPAHRSATACAPCPHGGRTRRRPPPAGGLQGPADPRRPVQQDLCGHPRGAWRARSGLGGAVATCAALHQGPDQRGQVPGRLDTVAAQPGAVGAGQLELARARGRRPGGGGGPFHTIQGPGGRQRGRRGPGRPLFVQVRPAQPSLWRHARGRQDRGEGHGVLPACWGKALARGPPRLAPGLKLPRSLVSLGFRVQRGFDWHACLHVITFLA